MAMPAETKEFFKKMDAKAEDSKAHTPKHSKPQANARIAVNLAIEHHSAVYRLKGLEEELDKVKAILRESACEDRHHLDLHCVVRRGGIGRGEGHGTCTSR